MLRQLATIGGIKGFVKPTIHDNHDTGALKTLLDIGALVEKHGRYQIHKKAHALLQHNGVTDNKGGVIHQEGVRKTFKEWLV